MVGYAAHACKHGDHDQHHSGRPHRVSHLPALRGDVWFADRDQGQCGQAHPWRSGRRVLQGLHLPEGFDLKQLYEDPDRLRKPVVRRGFDDNGAPIFEEVEWDEAFAVVGEFAAVKAEHGNEAIGVYLGNPNAHNLAWNTHARAFLQAIGSRSMFSASTVDQMPRHVASGYLYGNGMRMPVPDLDRTDLLVLLGTNPFVSNGSIAPPPITRAAFRPFVTGAARSS